MIQEASYLTLLFLAGAIACLPLLPVIGAGTVAALGLPLGILAWAASGVALLALGLPYRLAWIAGGTVASVAAAALLQRRGLVAAWSELRVSRAARRTLGLATLAVAAASALFSFLGLAAYSTDSLIYLGLARMLVDAGGVDLIRPELANQGLPLPILHSAAPFLGHDRFAALQPMTWLGLLALHGALLARAARPLAIALDKQTRQLLAALWLLVLPASYLFVFQAFYIHCNLLGGLFLLLFVGCGYLRLLEGHQAWLGLSLAGAIGFALVRHETTLTLAPFLLALLAEPALTQRERSRFAGVFAIIVCAWLVRLQFMVGSPAGAYELLGRGRALAIATVPAGILALAAIRRANPLLRLAAAGSPALALAALAVATALAPRSLPDSAGPLLDNLFFQGLWGSFWIFLVPVAWLLARERLVAHDRFITRGLAAYPSLLVALPVGLGLSYRAGWGDSGNRNLTHVAPVLLFHVLLALAALLRRSEPDR